MESLCLTVLVILNRRNSYDTLSSQFCIFMDTAKDMEGNLKNSSVL